MPECYQNRKRVAAIGENGICAFLGFLPFEHFMKNGPDMRRRIVGRQVKLN
jgi:hypothetical protein